MQTTVDSNDIRISDNFIMAPESLKSAPLSVLQKVQTGGERLESRNW